MKDFSFYKVAQNFTDHINRSVIDYDHLQKLIVHLATNIVRRKVNILDLGCSTGETIFNLLVSYGSKNIEVEYVVGVDNCREMFNSETWKIIDSFVDQKKIELDKRIIDIEEFMDENSCSFDVILSLYTMQFFSPSVRYNLIREISECMCQGGVFIMIEKHRYDTVQLDRLMSQYHYRLKEEHFSKEDIYEKMMSLKSMLIPFTDEELQTAFENSLFTSRETFYTNLNFKGHIMYKDFDTLEE